MKFVHSYEEIISFDNLLEAWREFEKGKKGRLDVQVFKRQLAQNILALQADLASKTYIHSPYEAFNLSDPKPRHIHKASVRDRLPHHALYRKLCWFFHQRFIYDSYSCRLGKGTHKALGRFSTFARKVSRNNTKTVWVLKCDIKKFFASIDQEILIKILKKYISDLDTLWLLEAVITSFYSTVPGKGLPLGNLTSQLLVNIYMNELDQFVKHKLKVKYYIRYTDDFVLMSQSKLELELLLPQIRDFLEKQLKLTLHPDKVFLKTLASGVDFLGWVHFPTHRVLRTATKKRMLKKLKEKNYQFETLQSYLGLLSHGDGYKLQCRLIDGLPKG